MLNDRRDFDMKIKQNGLTTHGPNMSENSLVDPALLKEWYGLHNFLEPHKDLKNII